MSELFSNSGPQNSEDEHLLRQGEVSAWFSKKIQVTANRDTEALSYRWSRQSNTYTHKWIIITFPCDGGLDLFNQGSESITAHISETNICSESICHDAILILAAETNTGQVKQQMYNVWDKIKRNKAAASTTDSWNYENTNVEDTQVKWERVRILREEQFKWGKEGEQVFVGMPAHRDSSS